MIYFEIKIWYLWWKILNCWILNKIIFLFSRNVSMGACAFWARVGGILAPQIIYLVRIWNCLLAWIFLTLSVWGPSYHGLIRSVYGCWCPGSLHRQVISSHDIGYPIRPGDVMMWLFIMGINPEAVKWGDDHYDRPLCPGLQPGPPSQTPGGLGHRYWSVSEVTWPPKLELRRWRSSGPSSLMYGSLSTLVKVSWLSDGEKP